MCAPPEILKEQHDEGKDEMMENLAPADDKQANEQPAFDPAAIKGQENGLFRACLNSTRSAPANQLRTSLVMAGLSTDVRVYREGLALFYAATKELETRLQQLKKSDEICARLCSLNYRFADRYETDLRALYGKTWHQTVDYVVNKRASDEAKDYIHSIHEMQVGADLAGAAFCLWGPLIMGGGASALPRVVQGLPQNATHIFAGDGTRPERKARFVQLWDSLATREDPHFCVIVKSCQDCKQGNNELIASVKTNPWWLKYLVSSALGVASTAIGMYLMKEGDGAHTRSAPSRIISVRA